MAHHDGMACHDNIIVRAERMLSEGRVHERSGACGKDRGRRNGMGFTRAEGGGRAMAKRLAHRHTP